MILGLVGVIMFSLKAVLAKLIYAEGISAMPVLTLRMVFALPFYLLILAIDQRRSIRILKVSREDIVRMLVFGLLGYYLASYFDFAGLQYIKAGLERVILFSYPTIVILFSWIFLKIRPNRNQIIAIFITYLGVITCFSGEFLNTDSGPAIIKGGTLIIMSAICYAGYLVGSEYLIPKFGIITFTSIAMIIASFAVIIHYIILYPIDIFTYSSRVYILSIIMALFSTVLPSYLISASIKEIGANTFGIIASSGPVSTIILAYIFLGEVFGIIQILGSLIVIAGIIWISRSKSKLT